MPNETRIQEAMSQLDEIQERVASERIKAASGELLQWLSRQQNPIGAAVNVLIAVPVIENIRAASRLAELEARTCDALEEKRREIRRILGPLRHSDSGDPQYHPSASIPNT